MSIYSLGNTKAYRSSPESIDHAKYCAIFEKLKNEFENRFQDFKKAEIHLAMFLASWPAE